MLPRWEHRSLYADLVIQDLRDFWEKYPDAEKPLRAWCKLVSVSRWAKPNDVKLIFGGNVDFVAASRAVFDIGGNKYRLVVRIVYDPYYRVMVKFVGTHAEYEKIDVEAV